MYLICIEETTRTRTHHYGLLIPKSIKDAIEIDEVNGNTLWMESIKMEMKNVRVALTQAL